MRLRELLDGIPIPVIGEAADVEIRDIRYDSRLVGPGDLFVAIPGLETDGHRYIGAAAEKGAAAVVCERVPEVDIPYVLVKNSRWALARLSANYFENPAEKLKLVGVTGTNGKTTTTFLLKSILEACTGEKVGLIGTNQNMIGALALETERTTPESYELHALFRQMAEAGCTWAVMEVSSHSLVLDRVAGLTFEAGVFTNLTQDHLDFHVSMDEYAAAKARLFGQCKRAVINLDDGWAGQMLEAAGAGAVTFSVEKNEADYVAKDIRLKADRVQFSVLAQNKLHRVIVHIPGAFSVQNALGVVACAGTLGISPDEAAAALSQAKGVKGRVEVVETGGGYTVLIDYAHTPDALENVLTSMKAVAPGRVVVLFGCGGDRDRKKRPLMGEAAARLADYVIVTSDNPRTEPPDQIIADILTGLKGTKTPHSVIPDRRRAIAYALDHAQTDDVIILAGKGHETYQIVGKTKYPMDEREIVAEHLAAMGAGETVKGICE